MDNPRLAQIGEDETSTPVMLYFFSGLCWGDLIIKKPFRPTTWLRSNILSDTLYLFNVKYLRLLMQENPRPESCSQVITPVDQILGFHVLPPAKEPLDYDPNEPHLRFDPVRIIMGMFQVEGKILLPRNSSLAKYLRDTHEQYTSIYEARINCPHLSKSGDIIVPFLLVRKQTAIFFDILKP